MLELKEIVEAILKEFPCTFLHKKEMINLKNFPSI